MMVINTYWGETFMRKSYQKILLITLAIMMTISLTLLTACQKEETGADNTQPAQTSSAGANQSPKPSTGAPGSSASAGGASASPASPTPVPTSASGKPITDSRADYKFVYGSVTIDGNKDEAWDEAQEALLDYLKIDNRNDSTEVIARAMWNEQGLYFSFEITDESISAPGEVGDWNNDSIYLYIDETQKYTGSFDDFSEGVYQFALLTDNKHLIPRRGEALPAGTYQFAYKKTNKGVFMEFFYKPTHMQLKAGTQFFVDFQYNDATNGKRDGALGWYNDTDDNARSELWGIGELIAKEYAVKK